MTAKKKTAESKGMGVESAARPVSLAVVRVDDAELHVARDGDQKLVSLRRGCEVLGLEMAGQLKKLKAKDWAVMYEKYTTGSDGKMYAMTMVDPDTFHGWLLSIDSRKVKPEMRSRLLRVQKTALAAVTAYFTGGDIPAAPPPEVSPARLDALEAAVGQLAHAMIQMASAAHVVPASNPGPIWTVESRLEELEWFTTSERQRWNIRDKANDLIRDQLGEEVSRSRGRCTYTRAQVAYLDRAIRIERIKAQLAEAERDPGLFRGVA